MFRADRQKTHAPTSFPASMSSSSLSSSFSSSASSSMLHHAVSPANSSHSDIPRSDQSGASPSSTPTKTHFPSAAVSPAPRSSSLGAMGQTYARPQPAVPLETQSSSALNPPTATSKGFKLKNAFGARRKQSEDSSSISLSLTRTRSKGKGRKADDASATSETDQSSGRRPLRAKQLTLQFASAFSGKQTVSAPTSPGLPSPPPVPPPKPTGLQTRKTHVSPSIPAVDNRRSAMVQSPGIAATLQYMQNAEPSVDTEVPIPQQGEVDRKQEKMEGKEVWRKSDSNMSFNTIRPGAATIGNRSSRPVSMAESLHSTHTIVPVNKRLSALVTDADFAMAEESGQDAVSSSAPVSGKASPSGSVKSRNRRSASLVLSSPFPRVKTPALASANVADEPKHRPRLPAESPQLSPPLATREMPTLTRAAANGYIASTTSGAAVQSTGNNIRGRLAAWSATANNTSGPSRQERHLPDIPPQPQRIRPNERSTPSTMRQTAVSITSGFSAGLAKRAVEKMGRALGGMHTGSGSGYSSSSSTYTAPSSFSNPSAEDLGRSHAAQSLPKHSASTTGHLGKGRQRRTPNAPSGAWSVASSTTSSSLSDSDAYSVPSGPVLGKCMRGPTRSTGGGAVFGRDLRSCVAETALTATCSAEAGDVIGQPPHSRTASAFKAQKEQDNNELEARRVPALVVRCAQHILAWGVQEEGLFRLTGRPSHMSKLRSEFDTGADYDLSECNLGDLDPHAVSSVFKAYLRELPEPILTHALAPYFEAVLSAETHSRESKETPHPSRGMRRPADAAGPKPDGNVPTLRKPPSLSTLAMPNFSGMRAPSESLVNALRSLIAGLPQENRDLLHTVTDLISATAKRSKETKMPLSNLLLVFCPSLNMNPPLLRVLCEAQGIWDVPPSPSRQPDIVDMKRETIMMDIGSDTPRQSESPSTDAEEVLDSTSDEVTSQGSHASAGREISPEVLGATAAAQQRPERIRSPAYGPRPLPQALLEVRRGPVATLYLDSECADDLVSQSFIESPAAEVLPPGATSSESLFSKDESSVNRSNSGSPALPNFNSPPSLSSSTDSLTSSETPSSSHLPLPEDHHDKTKISSRMPAIVDPADLALPRTPQRSATCPTVGGDIQFPSTPSMPISTLIGRPSVPKLSLNVSTPQLHGPASASSLRTRRIKKPSLHLLFTRRSSASLHSPVNPSTPNPYLQPPHSASPLSSNSPPLSAQQSVYTAQTSTSSLPPVLDLPIETSPLKMGMGIDEDKRRTIGAKPGSSHSNHTVTGLMTDEPSLPSPGTPAPSETPIASLYSTPSSSVLSFDTNTNTQSLRPRPRLRKSQGSLASSSFNHLSVVLPDEEAVEDGWAQSVLAAADTDGSWSPRNVMKFFGGGGS
ncbi:hypothetical protein PILCRDRAFT_578639 [Piloderma croceum F 1598]|uniref:Rho-GAP domain-containing protein n=1 Tax=Piloderma croceum (strain F 1598) TaxID=765440 RepID=A0A0C3AXZ7_PILCF|nr:hypothetical protein PILCRDRAFT_578639 [Piloderma croceum F 1598]